MLFSSPRHQPYAKEEVESWGSLIEFDWRIKRLKTVGMGLVLCINLGIDPPDQFRCPPSSYLLSWVDCRVGTNQVPVLQLQEQVSKNLEAAYASWSTRSRVRVSLRPTKDDLRRQCVTLRRYAKGDRMLIHYNGHGVPRPTLGGEIWVFDKGYTQYIPVSLFDVQSWTDGPVVFVLDCSAAARAIYWYERFIELRKENNESISPQLKDYIIMAACGAHETLPTDPDLPADLFTSCLTTPIQMALHWHCLRSYLHRGNKKILDLVSRIPGKIGKRETPLGELNWIFTAITDSIAYSVLPQETFLTLFRQDVLVASLFRNFLLAERVMRSSANCTPVSVPALLPCAHHPLWSSWDAVVESTLMQLEGVVEHKVPYVPTTFFQEQMQSLRCWLTAARAATGPQEPPEQLPVVLQVLLCQPQRKEALELISDFMALGSWGVETVLGVDLFPYLSKLLRSSNSDLRWHLVSIWKRILSVDKTARIELIKERGYRCFLTIVGLPDDEASAEERAAAYFVLAVASEFPDGQQVCLRSGLLEACLSSIEEEDGDSRVRRWAILALAKLWEGYPDALTRAVQTNAPEKLCGYLSDDEPLVRAAAAYALGTFILGPQGEPDSQLDLVRLNLVLTLQQVSDVSSVARMEVVIALCQFLEERQSDSEPSERQKVYRVLRKHLRSLQDDPHPKIRELVGRVLSVQFSIVPRTMTSTHFHWSCHTFDDVMLGDLQAAEQASQMEVDRRPPALVNYEDLKHKVAFVQLPMVPEMVTMNSASMIAVGGSQVCVCRGNSILYEAPVASSSLMWLDDDLLMVGGKDGSMYAYRKNMRLVGAWRALPCPVLCSISESDSSHLYTGGAVAYIRVWDLHAEQATLDIPTHTNAPVSCMTGGFAGYTNGIVKRVGEDQGDGEYTGLSDVVALQRFGEHGLAGIGYEGKVCIWDVRRPGECLNTWTNPQNVSALAVHHSFPLIACGSPQQEISIFQREESATLLRSIRYHEGFLEERIGPVTGLSFHPTELLLASATADKYVSIYGDTASQ